MKRFVSRTCVRYPPGVDALGGTLGSLYPTNLVGQWRDCQSFVADPADRPFQWMVSSAGAGGSGPFSISIGSPLDGSSNGSGDVVTVGSARPAGSSKPRA